MKIETIGIVILEKGQGKDQKIDRRSVEVFFRRNCNEMGNSILR